MNNDTNFYLQALDEWRKKNPKKRRSTDVTALDLGKILQRAQELKSECSAQGELPYAH